MSKKLKILLIEPYFSGSHKVWSEGLNKHSRHDVHLLTMEGLYWQWRMRGSSVSLAQRFLKEDIAYDLILASDMLDLGNFLSLTRSKTAHVPVALYFHENQLTYPWSPREPKSCKATHVALINYTSAMSADFLFFNSGYNQNSFFTNLEKLLQTFADDNQVENIQLLKDKSSVLPLGIDIKKLENARQEKQLDCLRPLILWNHRWEHDKNPEGFFKALTILYDEGLEFSLALLGENFRDNPKEFIMAKETFGKRVLHYGYVENQDEYNRWLWESDLLPVTSIQDFFGISVAEAIYCETQPLLPNRLAYPELLKGVECEDLFYNSFKQFLTKLRGEISREDKRTLLPLSEHISSYCWSKMIVRYDSVFEKMSQ
ncbi:MAG: DUF3524 domain-containing protein [Nitrospinae bacterium]|nr:DUF3524 domain-containing protein [Nitrospinota bacterium]